MSVAGTCNHGIGVFLPLDQGICKSSLSICEIAQGHPDPDETRSGRILVHQIGSALAGSTDRGEG